MVFFYPKGIHEWAQSDRLSLALNFYDKGMNFFLPSTHFLGTKDGITNVEFPIQSYLAAALGYLFGRDHISTLFRILNLCISLLGLYYLFLFTFDKTKNFILSLLPPVFLFSSPIFLFYSCNYLPDTAGLSIGIIAYYYFFKFLDDLQYKHLLIAISIITLATLIKTSMGIYFVAIAGHSFLILLFDKKQYSGKRILSFSLASIILAASVVGYFLYNEHLRTAYKIEPGPYFFNEYLKTRNKTQVFLATIHPVKSWDHFKYTLNERILGTWFNEYFLNIQYILLLVFCLGACYLLIKKPLIKNYYFQHLSIVLIGSLSFFYLMSAQFIDHDYYALAIFYPFITISLTITLISYYKIYAKNRYEKYISFSIGAVLVLLILLSYNHHKERISDHDWEMNRWMQKGAEKLANLQIPNNNKLLIMGHDAPNLGLVYFDRRGLTFNRAPHDISAGQVFNLMKENNLNYAISSNEYYNWIVNENKDAFLDLEILYQDEKCIILKPSR